GREFHGDPGERPDGGASLSVDLDGVDRPRCHLDPLLCVGLQSRAHSPPPQVRTGSLQPSRKLAGCHSSRPGGTKSSPGVHTTFTTGVLLTPLSSGGIVPFPAFLAERSPNRRAR